MNPLSDDFIKFIKSKDGQNELAYFHLDDLRVALLVQSLKNAESKPNQVIDCEIVKTDNSRNVFKKAMKVVNDNFKSIFNSMQSKTRPRQ